MEKTVLVTGGAQGIGKACAELFAQAGWRVIIHYNRSENEANALAGSLRAAGADCRAEFADFRRKDHIAAMFGRLRDQNIEPQALVNNAGIAQQRLACDISDGDWEELLAVNLSAAFYCCRAVLPAMIRRKSGVIVNISSVWGIVGASCEVHYSAAKAGLIGLTKALAKETGPSGIRVNCVAPGAVETAMLDGFGGEDLQSLRDATPLGRIGTPLEIARTVLFLASEDSSFITGQIISPNGGFVI